MGDRIVLNGEMQWLLAGDRTEIAAILSVLAGVGEKLTDTLLLLDFGNSVGLIDIPGLGMIEVVSSKWTEHDFERMLADLMAIASALPFASATPSALPYDRSIAAREDVLYHAFVYLRYILSRSTALSEQVVPSLELVIREPYRQNERVRRSIPTDLARNIDPAALIDIVSGRHPLLRVPTSLGSRVPLARKLQNHLPMRIGELQVATTVDTPENRFVKVFLQVALSIISGMRRVTETSRPSPFGRRILGDCQTMERTLMPIQQHPIWKDVGPMVHLPVGSTVLQRRRGYREVFRHFVKLRLAARVPLPRDLVWDLLEVKDIAQLYEVWCYFTLGRELQNLLGAPIAADRPKMSPTQIIVPWDLAIRWAGGTCLRYNARFRRRQPKPWHSYSIPLRPDIVLDVPNGSNTGLHLFDAKFRLEKLDQLLPADDSADEQEGEIAEERRGTFKRGDLYKMHSYRDAIPGARSVWVLYPGTEMRFFGTDGSLVSSLLTPLPATLVGVGAAPLLPEVESHPELRSVLARVVGGS